MVQISYLWQQFLILMNSLVGSLSWRNILDVTVVAISIYYIIKLVRQTRANSVLKGLAVILLLTWISDLLELSATNWILRQLINTGVIVLVVLFQPELRRGLEQIGRRNISGGVFTGSERKPMSSEHDIQEMIHALTNLSRRKVGALIVIENKTGLKDIIASGTMVDAEISSGLIENIFEPNTPLHDGAVVVRNGRITAAACFLPLSENSSISRELGTRHRAAIGISETTDATVLIVSEETGTISMAHDGRLTRYLDAKALSGILTELLSTEDGAHHLFGRNPAKATKEDEAK
ncbi:MAG: diadenylate cyclase CdaA [Clostridia bacterium]|nr:diadenylate cyclase CdaA [Clostridia bacterium]